MRTYGHSAWLALVAGGLTVFSCGGRAIEDPGGADGGAGGDAFVGGGCAPLPGCASDLKCPAGDGCNTCACVDGAWSCTEMHCIPQGCPDFGASPNAPCAPEGLTCTGPGRCPSTCTCKQSAWSCIAPPCPPLVCPPSPPPPHGSPCDPELRTCDYGSGCAAIHCYCGSTPEDSGWNCAPAGCDAGTNG
jgi:hypothetical protein